MAKKPTKAAQAKEGLPRPGDAFLMPLGRGLFGLCRVLAKAKYGRDAFAVAVSSWVGEAAPDVSDPRLREVYVETHHGWGPNAWRSVRVSGPVPETFQKLGTITPSEDEARLFSAIGTAWINLARERLVQWRWEHDREALLKEEQEAKEQWAREQADEARRRQEYLDALTLESLRKKRRFSEWEGDRPKKAIAECRKTFEALIEALVSLGPKPTKREVSALVRQCVETLNELDERHHGFIETGEREALCSEIDEIVYATGLRNSKGLADKWRDW